MENCSEFLRGLDLYPLEKFKALVEKTGKAICPTKRGTLGTEETIFVEVEDKKMVSAVTVMKKKKGIGEWKPSKGKPTVNDPKETELCRGCTSQLN